MKKLIYLTFIFCFNIILISCSSTTIKIDSTPAAKAKITNLNNQKSMDLGQTPLNLSTVSEDYLNAPVVIELATPGYLTDSILIPNINGVDLDLKRSLSKHEKNIENIANNNKSVDLIFEAVNLIHLKNYESAITKLTEAKKMNESISAIYELEANIHMIKKDFNKALSSYNEALKFNPEQINLLQMKNKLEKSLNISSSNSEKGAGNETK
jgi:tetratricopeptide (TPR) repeat protein